MLEKVELKIPITKNLAQEAEAAGLLSSESIEKLLRGEIKQHRIEKLFEATDQIFKQKVAPLSEEEIESEIEAARLSKR